MMRLLNRVLLFFLYSNLFIAGCAVLMAWQTSQLLLNHNPTTPLIGFIFFGSLCSYSFHWMLTEEMGSSSSRITWLRSNKTIYYFLLLAGVAGTVYFSLEIIDHWILLGVTAFITFLYSAPKIPHPLFRALRKVAIGKTFFLAFVWMHVTTVLPVLLTDGKWTVPFVLFAAGRFFFLYAICILFDRRDRQYDLSLGIRSLITWLSEPKVKGLFYTSLLLFLACTIPLGWYQFTPLTIVILLIPGLILTFLYSYAIQKGSDLFFYFVLDGMMALSSLLTLFL